MASLSPISGTLGLQRSAHLLRRATYGATRAEIDVFAAKTVAEAVQDLLQAPAIPPAPFDTSKGIRWRPDGALSASRPMTNSWWLYQAIDPKQPPTVFHKMTFFLHTCLTVSSDIVDDRTMWYHHLYLLMRHVHGSYKTLVRKMSVDNGMGRFLNIEQNRVGHPNENYARELLELFTVGKGPQIGPGNYTHYTEDDIRETARVLTGFRRNTDWLNTSKYDPDTQLPVMQPDLSRHDTGNKQFSAAFQNRQITGRTTAAGMLEELDDLIDMIFDQEAVSLFICRKLYRYFVNYRITPEVEQDIIVPLAETFRSQGFHFAPVLTLLFESQHFYDEDDAQTGDHTLGALIQNPLELWAGTLRFFQGYVPDENGNLSAIQSWLHRIQNRLNEMGLSLFNPSSVAGYEPMYQEPNFNRYWLNAATLPLRYSYAYTQVHNTARTQPVPVGRFNILDFIENPENIPPFAGPDPLGNPGPHEGAKVPDYLVQTLLDYLLPWPPDTDRYMYFQDVLLEGLSPINWMFEWLNYRSTGDASSIRPQLEKLLRAIVQSPEYQLH